MPLARPKHKDESVQSVIAHSNGLQGGVGPTPPPGSHKQGPALTVRSISLIIALGSGPRLAACLS